MPALDHGLLSLTVRERDLFDVLEARGGWPKDGEVARALYGLQRPTEVQALRVLRYRLEQRLKGTGWSIERPYKGGSSRLVHTEAKAA
jgi:hypothetical protein